MEASRLDYLLERYHTGTCTKEELAELNEWFHAVDHGHAGIEERIQQAGSQEALTHEMLADFKQRNRPKRAIPLFMKAAAAAVLLVSAGTYLYWHYNRVEPKAALAKTTTNPSIEPGSNKAVLTLANGQRLTLTGAANGPIANESGVVISKTADGQLVYNAGTAADAPMLYNTINIPRGGEYQLTLPDGSKVWLNAATTLRYPVRFAGAERRVELTGEAYFEIAHNKERPFIVAAPQQEIKVLGTHFNVKAYADEPATKTTLVEGKVEVTTLGKGAAVLKPGEQAVLTQNARLSINHKANIDEVIAWKSGYFLFDNTDTKTILKMISRWYDVDIDCSAMHKVEHFGGSFSRSSRLEELLANLEAISTTHFTIKERRIIVSN